MLKRYVKGVLGPSLSARMRNWLVERPQGGTPLSAVDRRGMAFRFFGEASNPHFTREQVRKAVEIVPIWYHTIDFGYGITAPGNQTNTWQTLGRTGLLELDLRGKTIIDVGAWDGFFSFVCKRQGAQRVLATDQWAWDHSPGGNQGFLTARELLASNVEHLKIDVFELSPATVGTFDIVLFLGVLYHLQDPFMALRRLREITRDFILVETHVVSYLEQEHVPVMEFYETNELNNDSTNWWGPNLTCLHRMMRAAGFPRIETVCVRYLGKYGRAVVKGFVS